MIMSILSKRQDGFGFFYGRRKDDYRQINIRLENKPSGLAIGCPWEIYVGGQNIGQASNKEIAEELAVRWMEENPAEEEIA